MSNKKDFSRERIEEALEDLVFIDEPELDIALLAKSSSSPCVKDCGEHCTAQDSSCSTKGMCYGKCLGRGDCVKQSASWCRDQSPSCTSKTPCSNKCAGVGLCPDYEA